jgi:CelD/BcsL family acetyltransferase involved in cellulose biosynthesis
MLVEIVGGSPPLEELASDWWRLFRSAPTATPFQSPAWLLPWSRHLGRGEIRTVLVRNGGELIGLAPFSLDAEGGAGVLRPLGSGVTDICDALIGAEGGSEIAVAAAIVKALRDDLAAERVVWDGLPPGSPVLRAAAELTAIAVSEEIAPVLRLTSMTADPLEAVPRGMRDSLRASRRRADALGALAFEDPGPADCGQFLDAIFALHEARWRQGGEPGVLGHPAVQAFHREAFPALLEAGLARSHLVRIAGRVAAAHYGLAAGRTHFYYIGGYDPELRAATPGHLAVAHAIERAIDEGATTFHFLRGDEPYKRRWGAAPERLVTLTLGH